MTLTGTLVAQCSSSEEYAEKLAQVTGNSAFSNIVEDAANLKITFDVDATE